MKIAAKQQALPLLAAGYPAAVVAEKVGVHPNSISRWLQDETFSEQLRQEIWRAMSSTRRALGHLARTTIHTAPKAVAQLERTLDDKAETSAARDRAAHRLLQHARVWGTAIDKDLDSREASGRMTLAERNNVANHIKALEKKATWFRNEVDLVLRVADELAKKLKAAGITSADELIESLDQYRPKEDTDSENDNEDDQEDEETDGEGDEDEQDGEEEEEGEENEAEEEDEEADGEDDEDPDEAREDAAEDEAEEDGGEEEEGEENNSEEEDDPREK